MDWRRVPDDQQAMKPGDTFTIDVPVYRRWWQFWRPRVIGQRRRSYVIVQDIGGPLRLP